MSPNGCAEKNVLEWFETNGRLKKGSRTRVLLFRPGEEWVLFSPLRSLSLSFLALHALSSISSWLQRCCGRGDEQGRGRRTLVDHIWVLPPLPWWFRCSRSHGSVGRSLQRRQERWLARHHGWYACSGDSASRMVVGQRQTCNCWMAMGHSVSRACDGGSGALA